MYVAQENDEEMNDNKKLSSDCEDNTSNCEGASMLKDAMSEVGTREMPQSDETNNQPTNSHSSVDYAVERT